jgi:outer membrane protein assembly factor BamB
VNPAGRAQNPARQTTDQQAPRLVRRVRFPGANRLLRSLALVLALAASACGGAQATNRMAGPDEWTSASIADDGPVYWSGVVGETVVQVSRKAQQYEDQPIAMLQLVGRDIATGETTWRLELALNASAWTSCVVAGDSLIVTGGARIASVNAARGSFNWIRDLKVGTVQRADVRDGSLWVQSNSSELLSLSLSGDGGRRWELPAGQFWVTWGTHNGRPMAVTSDGSWLGSATSITLWNLAGSEPEQVWNRALAPSTMAVLFGDRDVLAFQSDSYTVRNVRALPYESEGSVEEQAFVIPGTCVTVRDGVSCSETVTEGNLTFVTLRYYSGSSDGPAWTQTLLAPGGWCAAHGTTSDGPMAWRCQNVLYALDPNDGAVLWAKDLTQTQHSLDVCGAVGETNQHLVLSCPGTPGVELVGHRMDGSSSWSQRMAGR